MKPNQRIQAIRQNLGKPNQGFSDQTLRGRIEDLRAKSSSTRPNNNQRPQQQRPKQPGTPPQTPSQPSSGPQTIPETAGSISGIASAERNRSFTLANLNQRRLGLDNEYNDPSNPFSRASLLQKSYQDTRRGTLNNYAAAGQLYAGSLSNQRDNDRFNYEQADNARQREYLSELAGVTQGEQRAGIDYADSVDAAWAGALESAIQEPNDPAESPAAKKQRQRNQRNRNRNRR